MTGAALSVEGLTVTVGRGAEERAVVDDLSFALDRGETLCIVGESGSGKSMTALAIMGLLPRPGARVAAGAIRLGGEDLTTLPEHAMRAIRGDRIAMIFQEPMTSLNPVLTVGRQLVEAIRAHAPVPSREARARAVEALRAVRLSEPERRMKQHPHELSGGMRQRVMIAMAVALRADVLIADEPTTALDVTVQGEVLELIRDLMRDGGMGLVLITHDMGVAAEMADRVLVMQHGKAVEAADVGALFARPREAYTQKLLAAVPRIGEGPNRIATRAPLRPAPTPVVAVADLAVRFDVGGGFGRRRQVHAVDGVSFDIAPGETLALVGESGCGKSTVARAIAGLVPHDGTVAIEGRDVAGLTRAERKIARREVQIIFQDPFASLDPRMTVGDLVAEPLVIHRVGTRAERQERMAELFEAVGLPADAVTRYPHQFSGGQRQRICIARALALRPKLIIADESVSALDVSVQARVLSLLRELREAYGIAYLFISHDMAVVENVSDRVAVMVAGRLVELGTRDQVFGDPRHAYTKRLIDAVPQPDPTRRRPRVLATAAERAWRPMQFADVGGGHWVATVA